MFYYLSCIVFTTHDACVNGQTSDEKKREKNLLAVGCDNFAGKCLFFTLLENFKLLNEV